MRKLQVENPEVMQVAIPQEISRSDESRYDHRLHGLLLVTTGQAGRAASFARGPWIYRFSSVGNANRLAEQLLMMEVQNASMSAMASPFSVLNT